MYSDLDGDTQMPVPVGFGDLTPQQLGISPEASPFYEPATAPEPETTVDSDLETQTPSEFTAEEESLGDEIISRATAGFESLLRYAKDNPKVLAVFSIVGIGAFLFGRRSRQA